jgi:hypothetical protein
MDFYEYADNRPVVFGDPFGLHGTGVIDPPTVAPPATTPKPPLNAPEPPAVPMPEPGPAPGSGEGIGLCAANPLACVVAVIFALEGQTANEQQDTIQGHEKKKSDECENHKDCQFASEWQLEEAGIQDEHEFKRDFLGRNAKISQFDICACKDGSIVIKARGQCGKPGHAIETGHRWRN